MSTSQLNAEYFWNTKRWEGMHLSTHSNSLCFVDDQMTCWYHFRRLFLVATCICLRRQPLIERCHWLRIFWWHATFYSRICFKRFSKRFLKYVTKKNAVWKMLGLRSLKNIEPFKISEYFKTNFSVEKLLIYIECVTKMYKSGAYQYCGAFFLFDDIQSSGSLISVVWSNFGSTHLRIENVTRRKQLNLCPYYTVPKKFHRTRPISNTIE